MRDSCSFLNRIRFAGDFLNRHLVGFQGYILQINMRIFGNFFGKGHKKALIPQDEGKKNLKMSGLLSNQGSLVTHIG